jgi:hypothetical protein
VLFFTKVLIRTADTYYEGHSREGCMRRQEINYEKVASAAGKIKKEAKNRA